MRSAALFLCLATGASGVVRGHQDPPSLATALQRAGAYLADYERQASMVVSEELYTQNTRENGTPQTRILKSDILMADLGAAGWFGVRDVFEVNGQAVRDHQNRLLELVTSPAPGTLTKARQMAQESARFNIGSIERSVNMPTFVLTFLRETQQPRSTWTLGGRKKIDGHDTIELRFIEAVMPRWIETRDDAPAGGRFWVEPESGRIVRSELHLDSGGMSATITVTFGPAPSITAWVPLVMDEEYRESAARSRPSAQGSAASRAEADAGATPGIIDGHATYRNFRMFNVQSNAVIKR